MNANTRKFFSVKLTR